MTLRDQDIVLSHLLGRPREFIYAHPEVILTATQQRTFKDLCRRREAGEPIAYLTGHKEFYGLDFIVNQHVLIPRPDTELLVEQVINYFEKHKIKNHFLIADIGTGSGCIAVTLKKLLPKVTVLATDISKPALTVAKQNSRKHHTTIRFFSGNLLSALPSSYTKKIDCIVSNLPYLTKTEAKKFSLKFEPQVALTPANGPIDLIHQLLNRSYYYLRPNGAIFLEIGYNQAKKVKKLALTLWPTAKIMVYQDLGGYDRVVKILPNQYNLNHG